MLALAKLGILPGDLPGCSARGGCAALTSGPLGAVPRLGLPWSFVGVAWFAALLVGCAASCGRPVPRWLRWMSRIGAWASLGFLGTMAWVGAFCAWCAVTHLASLWAWWSIDHGAKRVESPHDAPPRALRALLSAGLALLAASALLWWGEHRRMARAEAERSLGFQSMVEALQPRIERTPAALDRLEGRRVLGNPESPLRVVVFSDFQCPDCARIDRDVESLIERGDVAIIPRHFPLCRECNPGMPASMHPDACRRAALAEAAGALGGDDAYRRAHQALFSVQAASDADPLAVVALATGLSAEALNEARQSAVITEAIARDVADATALGVTFTPMIFVNGREWKYYQIGAGGPGTLIALVDRLAKEVPPVATPPDAAGKLVEDWRAALPFQPPLAASSTPTAHLVFDASQGDFTAPDLVLWLDYRLPGARMVDAGLRELAAEGVRFRYRVLQFPATKACNPRSGFEGGDARACLAAAAAIATRELGGDAAYATMHAWLLHNAATASAEAIIAAAVAQGIDRKAFVAAFSDGSVLAKVQAEADLLNDRMRVTSLPLIAIDDRPVPRWSHPGTDVREFFRQAIHAAAEARKTASLHR